MNESNLIIIRGLPGSGKTTLAKTMTDRIHFEADQWFEDDEGNYNFNSDELKLAHEHCQRNVIANLAYNNLVVVSNTFTNLWEMQPYIDMCNELGKTYEIITCKGEYQNVHGVPDSIIQRMRERWED